MVELAATRCESPLRLVRPLTVAVTVERPLDFDTLQAKSSAQKSLISSAGKRTPIGTGIDKENHADRNSLATVAAKKHGIGDKTE